MDAWQERKMSAAVNTLCNKGFTYEGGEQWKPPLGKKPEWVDSPEKRYVFVSGRERIQFVNTNTRSL